MITPHWRLKFRDLIDGNELVSHEEPTEYNTPSVLNTYVVILKPCVLDAEGGVHGDVADPGHIERNASREGCVIGHVTKNEQRDSSLQRLCSCDWGMPEETCDNKRPREELHDYRLVFLWAPSHED